MNGTRSTLNKLECVASVIVSSCNCPPNYHPVIRVIYSIRVVYKIKMCTRLTELQ